jgi:HrpA-like RNA helicase
MERLDLKYASRASLEQRKGRAGRVNKGYCFRIMTENYFTHSLNNFINPEIMRCPLEKVILKTKISGIGEPLEILSSCINNPNDYDLGNAFRNLIDFGAISIPNNLNPSGKVTFIGEMIAKLPCDIKITRILLMGYCFRVFEQAAVICAFLNVDKDMFYMRHSFLNVLRDKLARHKLAADDLNLGEVEDFSLFDMRTWQNKVSFSDDSHSDHIAYLNCFNKWLHEYRSELLDEMSK